MSAPGLSPSHSEELEDHVKPDEEWKRVDAH
jgi:hypothetical protein